MKKEEVFSMIWEIIKIMFAAWALFLAIMFGWFVFWLITVIVNPHNYNY